MVSCGLWDRYLISLVQSNSVITRWMCQGVIQMDALAIDRGVFLVHSLIHITSLPLLLCVQYLVPCYDVAPLDYVANMKAGLDWSIIFPSDVYHQHGSDSKFWWERFSGSLTKLCEYTLIQNHTKGTRAWLYRIQNKNLLNHIFSRCPVSMVAHNCGYQRSTSPSGQAQYRGRRTVCLVCATSTANGAGVKQRLTSHPVISFRNFRRYWSTQIYVWNERNNASIRTNQVPRYGNTQFWHFDTLITFSHTSKVLLKMHQNIWVLF